MDNTGKNSSKSGKPFFESANDEDKIEPVGSILVSGTGDEGDVVILLKGLDGVAGEEKTDGSGEESTDDEYANAVKALIAGESASALFESDSIGLATEGDETRGK